MFLIEQLQLFSYCEAATIRQYGEMPRRLKIVRERKHHEDDLSFIPPYSEQAKYLDLANTFLSPENANKDQENVISIEQARPDSTSAADEIAISRKLG